MIDMILSNMLMTTMIIQSVSNYKPRIFFLNKKFSCLFVHLPKFCHFDGLRLPFTSERAGLYRLYKPGQGHRLGCALLCPRFKTKKAHHLYVWRFDLVYFRALLNNCSLETISLT